MESNALPDYVGKGLGLISQEWENIGLGDDPAVAASDTIDEAVERLTSLLLIRIAAWIQPRGTYPDLSTTTICRNALMDNSTWPSASLDEDIISQLKQYVKVILSGYQDVPYHNYQHCEHVTRSANKLMDMILHRVPGETAPLTYGFRDDPLMQFALLFSALIHDVQHRGIPNRQLAMEDDELAIKYNDQSIAENQSLFIGFSELLKSDYDKLRHIIFPKPEDYRRFRAACVNLVLATDIASPERSQIGKSKWKEAFGDPYETVERKVLKQLSTTVKGPVPATPVNRASRRMSTQSILSELSIDSQLGNARFNADLDDDSSVSLSPHSSENEDEYDRANRRMTRTPIPPAKSRSSDDGFEMALKADLSPRFRKAKGRSVLDSSRSAPGAVDGVSLHSDQLSGMALKFHRRLSSAAGPTPATRRLSTRLGLRRTMDLSGQSIEVYQSQGTRTSATGATVSHKGDYFVPPEQIDEMRESVVLETILKAADVAHNLQGFEQMAKWSDRLFLELRKAFVEGRGESPQNGWFRNQIGFIDAYLLPLARRLDDMGVFGDNKGAVFADNVEDNRDRWTREGVMLTAAIVMEGEKQFPGDDESTD
ncbi:3'5'-cyclic nucleotide phosphodiesterase [Nitzschia inconspicua]|uniref:3'5'-cyclic nucleotide phosphodiesterase n=1 Tax=Nitzschia inconspicua TaxID=303405 RepID=A0A9K3Q6Q5_9STRA|nr:3'5'-cyclic nucleotide phosphodiesterase [Nitzschia inconspicua]